MIDFYSTWPSTWHPKLSKNPAKRLPRSIKGIENIMQVGLDFGPLLGQFLVDLGAKLGGKLDPSRHQIPEKRDPKTISKICNKNGSKKSMRQELARPVPVDSWSRKNV